MVFLSQTLKPRFDYPTLTALADYVSEQLLPVTAVPDSVPASASSARGRPALSKMPEGVSEHLAILGGACHLPGLRKAEGLKLFLKATCQGIDLEGVCFPEGRRCCLFFGQVRGT